MNFIFRGNEILLQEQSLALPDSTVCLSMGLDDARLLSAGMPGKTELHACQVPAATEAPSGYAFCKLRAALAGLGDRAALANRAFQVAEWVRTHRYCGVCATPMQRARTELCFHCPQCGFSAYPRISPAMMVLIKRDEHILLARHVNYGSVRYTALAGFVEAGENIEEAILREVPEEVGMQVNNIQYFGSQSWPFPHSLMIAYTADYAGGELRMQEDEIADARWFGPGDVLPEIPATDSIAGRLIRANLPRDVQLMQA